MNLRRLNAYKGEQNREDLYSKILSNARFRDGLSIELKDYNEALIESGYGITRPQLLKYDKIDLRGIMSYKNDILSSIPDFENIPFNRKILADNYWFCYIPCFTCGVFQLNTARYIKYEIESMDISNNCYILTVQDYLRHHDYWEVGVKATAELHFPVVDKEKIISEEIMKTPWEFVDIDIRNSVTFKDLYRAIPIEKMNWTTAQIEFWEKYIVPYAESVENGIHKYKNCGSSENLMHIFLFCVILSNELLLQYKPKSDRKNKSGIQVKIEKGSDLGEPQKDKIIHAIGPICIKSEKTPKLYTKSRTVHYKTAVWKAKGGVRHMQDGRLVPFKESIRRRKCLKSDNSNVPQSIIQLKGNKKHKTE